MENAPECSEGQAGIESLSQKLETRQREVEQKLAKIIEARELLKRNPDLEKLLTILGRTGRNLF